MLCQSRHSTWCASSVLIRSDSSVKRLLFVGVNTHIFCSIVVNAECDLSFIGGSLSRVFARLFFVDIRHITVSDQVKLFHEVSAKFGVYIRKFKKYKSKWRFRWRLILSSGPTGRNLNIRSLTCDLMGGHVCHFSTNRTDFQCQHSCNQTVFFCVYIKYLNTFSTSTSTLLFVRNSHHIFGLELVTLSDSVTFSSDVNLSVHPGNDTSYASLTFTRTSTSRHLYQRVCDAEVSHWYVDPYVGYPFSRLREVESLDPKGICLTLVHDGLQRESNDEFELQILLIYQEVHSLQWCGRYRSHPVTSHPKKKTVYTRVFVCMICPFV